MEEEIKKEIPLKNKNKKRILWGILVSIILIIGCFATYDIATIHTEYNKNQKNINIPIFVYHDIVKEEVDIKHDYMQTTVAKFEEQIKGLKDLGYQFITFDDLVAYNKGEKKLTKRTCILTFDDGCLGVYENALSVIEKYKVPASLFIINENVGKDGAFSWEQAKQMEQTGLVHIYSHGLRHAEYNKETTETLVEETKQSYNQIEQELGKRKQKVFCYPYGLYTEEGVKKLEQEGFIQTLTDNKINNSKNLNLSKLHRCYPLSDSVMKIMLKITYRSIRYGA